MNYEDAEESLTSDKPSVEALELGADALSFVQTLHDLFAEHGMTTNTEPDLNELENLIDALHGELAACCIFLAEPSFTRVPDMMRVIGARLETVGADSTPPVVAKGFTRLAKRIENTRVHMQALVKNAQPDSETP